MKSRGGTLTVPLTLFPSSLYVSFIQSSFDTASLVSLTEQESHEICKSAFYVLREISDFLEISYLVEHAVNNV